MKTKSGAFTIQSQRLSLCLIWVLGWEMMENQAERQQRHPPNNCGHFTLPTSFPGSKRERIHMHTVKETNFWWLQQMLLDRRQQRRSSLALLHMCSTISMNIYESEYLWHTRYPQSAGSHGWTPRVLGPWEEYWAALTLPTLTSLVWPPETICQKEKNSHKLTSGMPCMTCMSWCNVPWNTHTHFVQRWESSNIRSHQEFHESHAIIIGKQLTPCKPGMGCLTQDSVCSLNQHNIALVQWYKYSSTKYITYYVQHMLYTTAFLLLFCTPVWCIHICIFMSVFWYVHICSCMCRSAYMCVYMWVSSSIIPHLIFLG